MRVLVTGASGYLGLAVVEELVGAGHQVLGLVRSEAGGERLRAAGGVALEGDLQDAESLTRAARDVDAVAHLGWVAAAPGVDPVAVDRAAIDALGEGLTGRGGRLVIASGVLGLLPGRLVKEEDRPSAVTSPVLAGRAANADAALALQARGVAPVVVRLAPTVHDDGRIKPGFAGRLVETARRQGAAGYPGDGTMRWSAVHRQDAARLFRLAVEEAPAGAVLHGVAEEGIAQREIAETIGEGLGMPTTSLESDRLDAWFGWLAPLVLLDAPATSSATRELLGWEPTGLGLLQDLRDGAYFEDVPR